MNEITKNQYTPRSPEKEANRLAALRSPEVRKKISDSKLGIIPKNFGESQKKAWEANRKDVLTYAGIHAWVRRNWGKADKCELCFRDNLSGRQAHWMNKDHKYSRDRNDWMMGCRKCHAEYDMKHNNVSFRNGNAFPTTIPTTINN